MNKTGLVTPLFTRFQRAIPTALSDSVLKQMVIIITEAKPEEISLES
jgi:hypothetical protein